MNSTKIMIIEDDADIREGVRILLESEGYFVTEAENGTQGLSHFDESFSLIILDVMMPGISGLKTCEEIRKISVVPILFLTAKSNESDKLIGLLAGADDYLVKPFSYAELLGRVKALLRRYQIYNNDPACLYAQQKDSIITIENISVSEKFNEVYVDDKLIDLTETEYKILVLLMKYPKKIFSARNIYESVWNEDYLYSSNNTVMVHIRKIRSKIEKHPDEPEHIKTVWGRGYRFE